MRLLVFLWLTSLSLATIAEFDEGIRARIESSAQNQMMVAGAMVQALPSLRRFYEMRAFQPAWTAADGSFNGAGLALLDEILRSHDEGLNPHDYHLPSLLALQQQPTSPGVQVDTDLLFSDAWLVLASHYLGGRVDPVTIDAEWVPSRRTGELPALLERALREQRIVDQLQQLLPQYPGYAHLRNLLADLRKAVQQAPSPIPRGNLLKPGMRDARVPALRARLGVEGESDDFDETLVLAVKLFQQKHGLEADGIIGDATLRQLNAGPAERIDQVLANMERWRWMPAELGERHVNVNIAGFRLEMWDKGDLQHAMKVIVGRPYRRTPLFSDRIRYLVFNPAWNVPRRLAVQDKLPQLRKDAASLQRAGFVLLRGHGSEEIEIDPRSVDWQAVSARNFDYRLRQKPGPDNALGRVKIMFPNRFDVYLHDTSNPELFAKGVRSFSSGCIRLEQPSLLVNWLLVDDPAWNEHKIAAAMAGSTTETVVLKQPVPVHLQYWTVWVDDQGQAHFLDDIYQRDPPLAAALQAGVRQ